mgnify:CR=1 FL=1
MNYRPHWDNAVVSNGYRLIFCPDHPNAWKSVLAGYVYEHRLVAERKIGRLLRPDEHVHHINESRSDNHPDNLQVLSNSEHARLHALKRQSAATVTLDCPCCGRSFTRERRKTHLVKRRNKRTFCSRGCIARFTVRTRKPRCRANLLRT